MKLVPYEKSKLNYGAYKVSNNYKILNEFVESGLDCARVDGFTSKTAGNCAAALKKSIKRYKFGGISAISRKGCVYLIREN